MNEENPLSHIKKITPGTKFAEAIRQTETELSGNPDQKYRSGSIQKENANRTVNGEYKSYIEEVIQKTKDNILKIYEKIENNSKATFHPNPKDYPNGYDGEKNNLN